MTEKEKDEKPLSGRWRKVDPSIWSPGRPLTRFQRVAEKLLGPIRFFSFWTVVLIAPFFALISFLAAYSVVGAAFFGPFLILLWGGLTVGFIVAMEKSGYARNFEDKTFKLTLGRLLALPLVFLIILGGFFFLVFVLHRL